MLHTLVIIRTTGETSYVSMYPQLLRDLLDNNSEGGTILHWRLHDGDGWTDGSDRAWHHIIDLPNRSFVIRNY